MFYAASYHPHGAIARSHGSSLAADLLAMFLDEPLPVEPAPRLLRPDADWWDGAAWASRPLVPEPPALVAGVEAVWSGLPIGAEVTVTDPATGIVAGSGTVDETGTMPLTLAAGPWQISVNEVFPHRAAEWVIEVAPE
jgi:hypothetical protein